MLTLSLADLTNLTNNQLEALSGFIRSFQFPHTASDSAPKKTTRVEKAEDVSAADDRDSYLESLTPEAAFGLEPQTLGNGGLTKDDAHNIVYGKDEFASPSVDKSGLPWDERIHSSSKAFNADGTWRKKRGVSDALVAEVELQLKALMAVPSPVHVQTSPFPEVALASIPAPPAEVVPFPVASPVPLPPDFDPKAAFINFIKRSADAVREKKITQAEVESVCSKHGVASIPLLGNRLDLVPTIAIEVEQLIVSR